MHTGADDRCDQELLSEIPPTEPNLTSDFPSESDSPSINVKDVSNDVHLCVCLQFNSRNTAFSVFFLLDLSTLHVRVYV